MRGDQLAWQCQVARTTEASLNGLTVAEIAKPEETGIPTSYRDLKTLQAAGFPLYTEKVERASRWAFIDTFKFKFLSSLSLTKLRSFVFTAFRTEDLKDIPSYESLDSMRAIKE